MEYLKKYYKCIGCMLSERVITTRQYVFLSRLYFLIYGSEGDKDNHGRCCCSISNKVLANLIGCSASSITRDKRRMEGLGLIASKWKTVSQNGEKRRNITRYHFMNENLQTESDRRQHMLPTMDGIFHNPTWMSDMYE